MHKGASGVQGPPALLPPVGGELDSGRAGGTDPGPHGGGDPGNEGHGVDEDGTDGRRARGTPEDPEPHTMWQYSEGPPDDRVDGRASV